MKGTGGEDEVNRKPFPDSLCHVCAAPPHYIHTERSTFIRCPILKRYPPQPVLACEAFRPAQETDGSSPQKED